MPLRKVAWRIGPLLVLIDLTIKTHLRYDGKIVLAALDDGEKHDVPMSPVLNELSPAGDIC
jgi:hypothetical protein